VLILFILLLTAPLSLTAADLVMKTASDKISAYVSDIPCITLKKDAPVEVSLEEAKELSRVYDSSGVTYSAATLQEATDGYLRLRNVCVIQDVKIVGESRISVEAIRFRIKSAPGSILHKNATRKDIEEIYSMGYFETVDAGFENGALTFTVKEYPVILTIEVQGNKEIKSEDILKAISMKKFDILNTKTLKTSIDRIISLYREKGYYSVAVDSETKKVEGGINLTFTVKENTQLYIKKVSFDGNTQFSARKLRGAMETQNRWWWGMFGHNGSYLEETLDTDLLRIEQLYGDAGYMKARAGRPTLDVRENKGIYITIPIDEGPLFYIGKVDITGDLIKPKAELLDELKFKPGDKMSRSAISQSVEGLRDVYMDKGFAYVQINPDMTEGDKPNTMNITLKIKQGKPVHIDSIHIRGDTKTRDKVIRRELKVDEGDLYSSTAIKQSKDSLNRLGYFKNSNIDAVPRSDDTMSMLVDVEETTTGAFSFGFAYSSVDRLMGTMSLSESNLMGYGLKSRASVEYGAQRKTYSLSFEEPWLFDHPVSLGADIYNTEKEYTYYTKKARGGNIRLSYPLFERVRHSISYSLEDVLGLSDIDPTYRDTLTEEEINGYLTSSVTNTLYRDTTNDYFRPTRGSDSAISLEYAGLGGDYHYTRTTAKYAQFFPLYKDKVALMLKFRWGTINPAQGDTLPEDQLFTLGGMNSIRGFKYGDIGPRDSYGNVIGGRRMFISNTEITFPVFDVPGLSGVLFFDQGNAYDKKIDLTNLKRSYGAGIRWVTPMGPLRIEYGKVIHPEEYESSSRWDFSVGTFF
jgi:outer membrane protein insertion porin family